VTGVESAFRVQATDPGRANLGTTTSGCVGQGTLNIFLVNSAGCDDAFTFKTREQTFRAKLAEADIKLKQLVTELDETL
jgi:hypothetical protein